MHNSVQKKRTRCPPNFNTQLTSFLSPYCHLLHMILHSRPECYQLPSHHTKPPSPIVTPKCQAIPQAIANRYFGLNTVQMNKCCLSTVHASITAASIAPDQKVSSAACARHSLAEALVSLADSSFRAISFSHSRSRATQSATCISDVLMWRCGRPCAPSRSKPARDQ